MDGLCEKISNSELEILKVLWKSAHKMKLAEIRKEVTNQVGWSDTMIKTLLYRLVDKGVIKCQKREVNYYYPTVDKRTYYDYVTRSLADKLYNGSAKNLVVSLLDNEQLTPDDLIELYNMFHAGDFND